MNSPPSTHWHRHRRRTYVVVAMELLSCLLVLLVLAATSPAPTEAIKLEEFRTCGDTGFCRRQRTVPRTRTVLRMDDSALVYVVLRCAREDLISYILLHWNGVLLGLLGPMVSSEPWGAVALCWNPADHRRQTHGRQSTYVLHAPCA